ncbi:MAG: O-antigen ligase family protein [bacterium]
MKNWITKMIIAIPFVPLLFDANVFFPFISPKVFVLRFFAFLIAVCIVWDLFGVEKESAMETIGRIVKNKLFKVYIVLLGVITLSSLFAVDAHKALMGDIERSEGLITHLCFSVIVFGAVYAMTKKDWIAFAKSTIVSCFILFVSILIPYIHGANRPSSFVDNPIFLAAYFIFTLTVSALLSTTLLREGEQWKSTFCLWGFVGVLLSFFGLIITETRGAILGVMIGLFSTGIVLLVRSWSVVSKKQKIILFASLLLFVSLVLTCLFTPFGQKIPGFKRLSESSHTDFTKTARFLNIGISLQAVNPVKNGIKPLLIGWGQDNYNAAWYKNYNPKVYEDDKASFDRTHNKIFDVLVMNGLFALLLYLFVWALIIRTWFRAPLYIGLPLFFWCVAHFIQNLFAFESIVNYIPFFLVVAFTVWYQINSYEK